MTTLENADLLTAIVTPFNSNNEIDFNTLEKLTNSLIDRGCNGFVIGGTTGETPELSHEEKIALYTRFGQIVDGRVPVIAGTGSNNPQETIALTNEVGYINGIDYALVVVPPYNKPNQRGMLAHFKAVADNINLPIIIYNIPGRTGTKMAPETVAELAKHPNIAGIKQCAPLEELQYIIEHTGDDFLVFTGEDAQALTSRVLGANGVISVASHIYVRELRQMFNALYRGNYKLAGKLQRLLTPKMAACFMYPSPSPVKAVLNAQGFNVGECRLPILPLNKEEQTQLEEALNLPLDSLENKTLPLDL